MRYTREPCWKRVLRTVASWPEPVQAGVALIIIILFALVAVPAHADSEARNGADWVRLTARPCTDEAVLRHIPDIGRRLDFRAATASVGGQDYAACWTPVPGGVGLVFDDGDAGFIDQQSLRPVPDA